MYEFWTRQNLPGLFYLIGNSYQIKTLRNTNQFVSDAHDAQAVVCRFATARQRKNVLCTFFVRKKYFFFLFRYKVL